jgi:hypothetical protein
MKEKFRRLLPADVFLLIGNEHTYVAATHGRVFRCATRVLLNKKNNDVIAFGDDARTVEHAGLAQTRVVVPFDAIEIFDEQAATAYLRSLFRLALGSGFLLKPRVWLAISSHVTPFMRELLQSVAVQAGARELILVNSLLAACVGEGLDVFGPHGYAAGSLAGGYLELGLVSFGHVQVSVPSKILSLAPAAPDGNEWRAQWNAFLRDVPTEFAPTLMSEGLLLSVSNPVTEFAENLTQFLGVPVILSDRPTLITGLRALAGRKGEWNV